MEKILEAGLTQVQACLEALKDERCRVRIGHTLTISLPEGLTPGDVAHVQNSIQKAVADALDDVRMEKLPQAYEPQEVVRGNGDYAKASSKSPF